ncbi:hypothetical protein [Yinghuangia soli]|uniref:Uncharacterized protein n=1 Tax=Yinghuangia soli TaxID=2908204 RepID=A0AA41U0H8_9ACTN|nr:hypothetical protein [Yinghuangia soli]MCF2529828.1 hypothetical protein [Yinghuangia soli]
MKQSGTFLTGPYAAWRIDAEQDADGNVIAVVAGAGEDGRTRSADFWFASFADMHEAFAEQRAQIAWDIQSLLWHRPEGLDAPAVSWDPLVEDDALLEAQILCVQADLVVGTVGILLEFRTALQYRTGNTALIVVRRAESLQYAMPAPSERPYARVVMGSGIQGPKQAGEPFSLHLSCSPGPDVHVTGRSVEFYLLEVPGLGGTPPDYADGARFRAGLPGWGSSASVLAKSEIGPAAG